MSTYPVIVAGMEPTSALLASMLPQDGYKSSDQPIASNNTVLENDSALVVPVAASAKYDVRLLAYYTGDSGGAGGIVFAFAVPSGASAPGIRYLGMSAALAVQYGTVPVGGSLTFGSNGTGNVMAAELAFTLSTNTTGGNLQLQWRQNTSDATATTVKAGSLLTARRIA